MTEFAIKDSGGERREFAGGMVRDTAEGKTDYLSILFGPLFKRVAEHLTKGRGKYPDPMLGVPNWTLAQGPDEYVRAKQSAFRHFIQWLEGDRDEDHAAAVVFNLNVAEYVLERQPSIDPGLGATPYPDGPAPPPISDVPASKPWIIVGDGNTPSRIVGFGNQMPANKREGKWTGTLGSPERTMVPQPIAKITPIPPATIDDLFEVGPDDGPSMEDYPSEKLGCGGCPVCRPL